MSSNAFRNFTESGEDVIACSQAILDPPSAGLFRWDWWGLHDVAKLGLKAILVGIAAEPRGDGLEILGKVGV
jgi:hypothetical protein